MGGRGLPEPRSQVPRQKPETWQASREEPLPLAGVLQEAVKGREPGLSPPPVMISTAFDWAQVEGSRHGDLGDPASDAEQSGAQADWHSPNTTPLL